MMPLMTARKDIGWGAALGLAFILIVVGEMLAIPLKDMLQAAGHDEPAAKWIARAAAALPVFGVCLFMQRPFSLPAHARRKWMALACSVMLALAFFAMLKFSQSLGGAAAQAQHQTMVLEFRAEMTHLETLPWLSFVLAFHLLLPVIEECTFRGLVFTALARRFHVAVGHVVTAGLFAVIHSSYGLLMFFLSLAASGLVQYSGTLGAAVAMHVLYNTLVTLDFLK